ncbi:MAG: hypothetical protein ACJ71K_11745 [Nitrososphaeraceae archaeon]|jgi:amino acid transporter
MPTKGNNSLPSHIAALGAILGSAGLIFFAYFGFENIVNIAKNPTRTIIIHYSFYSLLYFI